jgi:hypothetical protein
MKKTLTTTLIIAAYFAMMSALGIIAAVPGSIQKNAKESVRREIIRNISCPDFINTNSDANEVKAVVKVNETGTVSVQDVNSANPQLKEYVISQLQKMKLKGAVIPEQFVLVIKFKIA